ncbi:unnamed protein product [Caenorhabditis angaria]|uniref:RING-type domain-containing protein n=1 Tax=Caenorhabditis angaria TaxID=860376 RepID=A0A9P1I4W4_9PELO|nr:unnamed protein product [Caenorhabditis angaria]
MTTNPKDVLLEISDSAHLCRICYEEFNDRSKVSRILSCGHSFCTECLLAVVRASNSSFPICPECRKLTKQTVLSLPVNFHFMQMVRKMGLSVDSPEEEVSSTAATTGREDQPLGELEMHNRLDELSMPELIGQFRTILACMKDKTSQGMYQHYSYGENNFPLSICMDKIREIDEAVDVIENSLTMFSDDEDDNFQFEEEEEDDDEEEDPYDTDGTSSQHYGHLMSAFGNMNVGQRDIVYPENISDWAESLDDESRYTADVFTTDTNPNGQAVLRCSVCECQVPLGSEGSHLGGRRHAHNSDRRLQNLPPVSIDQWNARFRRRQDRNNHNFQYPIPPPPPPHFFNQGPSNNWSL